MDKNREYMEREKRLIGNSTVDFNGPVLNKGKGINIIDLNGKKILDFTAQISLLNTGYRPKDVVDAIKQAASRNLHACISPDWPFCFNVKIGGETKEISKVALAERLIDIASAVMPFNKRVYVETTGATAVNLALKIAKITDLRNAGFVTQDFNPLFEDDIFIPAKEKLCRFSILGFRRAFHGRHAEAQCLTNSKTKQLWAASSSCAFGRLPFPLPGLDWDKFLKKTKQIINELLSWGPVIAFVFEPVQGEGGMNIPDAELLKKLIDYMKEEEICTIDDEVQGGFGRTGKMLACEHFNIQPDMIVLSKSLGAGLPIGAVVVNDEKFPNLEPGMHSGSLHASPVPVAAAIANIDFIKKNRLVERSANHGAYAIGRLKAIQKQKNCEAMIKEVRGLGLMIGIEFYRAEIRDEVLERCLADGLLLAPAGEKTIRFTPPLIVTIGQIDKALDILEKALGTTKIEGTM